MKVNPVEILLSYFRFCAATGRDIHQALESLDSGIKGSTSAENCRKHSSTSVFVMVYGAAQEAHAAEVP